MIPFSRNPSTVSIRPQPYNVLRIEADHMSPVPRPNVYFNKAQHANGESQLTCPHEDDMKRSKLVKQLSCSHQDLDSEESMKHRPTRHNFYNTNQEASHMHWDDGKHPRWEGFIPVYVPTSKFRSLNEMRALPGFWMANENKPNFSMKPKTKLQINKDHGIQKKSALPDREEKGTSFRIGFVHPENLTTAEEKRKSIIENRRAVQHKQDEEAAKVINYLIDLGTKRKSSLELDLKESDTLDMK